MTIHQAVRAYFAVAGMSASDMGPVSDDTAHALARDCREELGQMSALNELGVLRLARAFLEVCNAA